MSTSTTPTGNLAAPDNGAATPPPQAAPPARPVPPRKPGEQRHNRFRRQLSLQSKILLMLLLVSILSTLVIGYQGYRSGTETLESQLFSRLTSLRQTRATQLEAYLETFREIVLSYSEDLMVVDAAVDFRDAFNELEDETITPEQQAAIEAFYQQQFIPALAERSGETPTVTGYLPTSNAQKYLQYWYSIGSTDFAELIKTDDPGDGSSWTAVHRLNHPIFRNATQRFGFDDFMIVDDDTGNIVYNAYKGVDFGSNLESGPLKNTSLGRLFAQSRSTGDVSSFLIADFETYRPSYGSPVAFVASPIYAGSEQVGILIIQVPSDGINEVMTGNNSWEQEGLGSTGETFLVGSDWLMRSNSRLLIENPEQFKQQLISVGYRAEEVDRIVQLGTTIMQFEVRTDPVEKAQRGLSGTEVSTDYFGHQVLSSYAPLNLNGLDNDQLYWVIVAKIDASEVFAPIDRFTRLVAVSTLGIIIAVTCIALLLSRLITRPIRRLTAGAQAVAAGNLDTHITVTSGDELGELGNAFNSMTRSLRANAELLEEQERENERMLLNVMPDSVARRYQRGDDAIAEHHSNVTVLFADLAGFIDLSSRLPADRSAALLNQLVRSFDDTAERYGIEKVKTIGASYMAACGVSVPRVDHAKRAVDFAIELRTIVERFNRDNQSELGLRVGIASGPLTAGIVGKSKFVYDMWGETVNLAYRVQRMAPRNEIMVTRAVYEKLQGVFELEPAGEVETRQGTRLPVWSVGST